MTFGTIIRERRQELELTIRGAADAAKISAGYWCKIESLGLLPTGDVVRSLCSVLSLNQTNMLGMVMDIKISRIRKEYR